MQGAGQAGPDPAQTPEQQAVRAYEQYAAYFHEHLKTITRNEADAWDLTQETFVNYIAFLKRGGRVTYLFGFLYRTASNLAVKQFRRRRRRAKILADSAGMQTDVVNGEGRMEARSLLAAVIDRLDPSGKVVAKALLLDEMSTTEICEYTGFSRGRVRRRISKIRALAKNIDRASKYSDPFRTLRPSISMKGKQHRRWESK